MTIGSPPTLPAVLVARPQWVVWRLEPDPDKPDKPKKEPYDATTGYHASSTDKRTWCPYRIAVGAAAKYTGVGYVFASDDPYTGIDLDGCIDATGEIAAWAMGIITRCASYAEISPSGTGVKIWVEGSLPSSRKKKIVVEDGAIRVARKGETPDGGIELYDRGRYFTVTGQRLDFVPVEVRPAQAVLDELHTVLGPVETAQSVVRRPTLPKSGHAARWAEDKMQWICDQMADAAAGNLHNRRLELGKLAGGLVATGLMTAEEAVDRLYAARVPESHGQQERKAICDGVETGIASPLDMPTFPTEQGLVLKDEIAYCPMCETVVRRSDFPYFGASEKGWYCPQCKGSMKWPIEAYTPLVINSANNVELCEYPNGKNAPRPNAELMNSANSANSATGDMVEEGDTWELPIPLGRFSIPTFPIETLPTWLQDFVAAEAVATQTPQDLSAMLGLSVIATALQKKFDVMISSGWSEPLNIYTLTALPPGSRKSAVFAAFTHPLVVYERLMAEKSIDIIARAETELEIAKSRVQQARAEAAKSKTGEDKTEEAVEASKELARMKVPAQYRLIADNATSEKLASLLMQQGGRIALLSAEADLLDIAGGQYSDRPNFGTLLKAHAGDTIRVDRVNRPAEYVERPALTIGLTIQPDVLHGLADTPGFKGRGLLGRFLYALPVSTLGHRAIDPPPVSPTVHETYERSVQLLLEMEGTTDDKGNAAALPLRLSPDARKALAMFERWLEPQLAETGDLGMYTDWAGKLVGAVARIAGLLHIADGIWEKAPQAIPTSTIERAITIGRYLIAHAKASFAEMGADGEVSSARHIMMWIKNKSPDGFSKRDLFEGVKGRFKRVDAVDPILSLLELHGYIREFTTERTKGRGRKPSPRYEVNPLWLSLPASHNSHNSHNSDAPHQDAISEEGATFAELSQNSEKHSHNTESAEKAINAPAVSYSIEGVQHEETGIVRYAVYNDTTETVATWTETEAQALAWVAAQSGQQWQTPEGY